MSYKTKCQKCEQEINSLHYGQYECPSCGEKIIFTETKENNNIRRFESGAIRDSDDQKEDYIDALSWTALKRYADYMKTKASLYPPSNFKLGIPIKEYEKSLTRHLTKYLINKYENGDLEKNSDHLSAIIFNCFGIMHEEERIKNKCSKVEKI